MIYDSSRWLKNYDPDVSPEIEPPAVSLIQLLTASIKRYPDRPAVNYLGLSLNYAELERWADRFAAALTDSGLGAGDVVALNLANIPHYIVAVLGCLKAGCTASGLSPLATLDEMVYQLNDCASALMLTSSQDFSSQIAESPGRVPKLRTIILCHHMELFPESESHSPLNVNTASNGIRVIAFPEFAGEIVGTVDYVDTAPQHPCFIQYTGGTTGAPKGAVLSNRNVVAMLTQLNEWEKLEPGIERNLVPFPLSHVAGLIPNCLMTVSIAGEQTLIPNPRDLDHLISEWDSLKPTWAVLSPTLLLMLLNEPAFHQLDFSALKFCFSGSAPFSSEGLASVEQLFGQNKIAEAVGMTESSSTLAVNPVKGLKKIGSVGLPISSTLVRIVDVEDGITEMPIGEAGEMLASGPQVMEAYYKRPEETEATLVERDGRKWLYTGDIARMDEDGYLYMVDRKKDMVVVGGYKVFSTEVEARFYEHPAVMMCAIIGVPNPERPGSEIVKLVAQKSADYSDIDDEQIKAELLAFARERLSPYKVPKLIEFVKQMPLTAVGKIDKKAVRSLN